MWPYLFCLNHSREWASNLDNTKTRVLQNTWSRCIYVAEVLDFQA